MHFIRANDRLLLRSGRKHHYIFCLCRRHSEKLSIRLQKLRKDIESILRIRSCSFAEIPHLERYETFLAEQ